MLLPLATQFHQGSNQDEDMYSTQVGGHCFGVGFSPFTSSKFACVTSNNFGLNGKGCLHIFEKQGSALVLRSSLTYQNGLYDLAWSEFDDQIIVTVSNDGHVQIWNISLQQMDPVKSFQGHKSEINSIVWNLARDRPLFATASWDSTVKLWDPSAENPISTLSDHDGIVYGLSWSPHLPAVVLSCSGDGDARTWDLRTSKSNHVIHASSGEVLSCDWTKYDPMIFVTSGTDSKLKLWDLRRYSSPMQVLAGHMYPARRVKASPHCQGILASVSYDKTTRIWNFLVTSDPVRTLKHHSEFVTGLDFNLESEAEVADCSWDKTIAIFNPL